jgi:hypothetical protein
MLTKRGQGAVASTSQLLPSFLPLFQSTKNYEHIKMTPNSYAKVSHIQCLNDVNYHYSPDLQNSGIGCISHFHFIVIFVHITVFEQCSGQRNATELAPAPGDWYVS